MRLKCVFCSFVGLRIKYMYIDILFLFYFAARAMVYCITEQFAIVLSFENEFFLFDATLNWLYLDMLPVMLLSAI